MRSFPYLLVAALALLAVILAACATAPEPRIVVKEVATPVATSCVPKAFRDPPETPDTDAAIKATAGPGELLHLLGSARLLYRQWIAEARPVIAGCR